MNLNKHCKPFINNANSFSRKEKKRSYAELLNSTYQKIDRN